MVPLLCKPTPRHLLLAVAAAVAAALAFGFVLELGFGVRPCPMCWWQRYAHLAIVAAALLGAYTHPRVGAAGIAAAGFAGAAVATWQVAAQQAWLPFPASCRSGSVAEMGVLGENLMAAMAQVKIIPCDVETFTLFGLSLAAWNLPLMLLVTGVGIKMMMGSKHS